MVPFFIGRYQAAPTRYKSCLRPEWKELFELHLARSREYRDGEQTSRRVLYL